MFDGVNDSLNIDAGDKFDFATGSFTLSTRFKTTATLATDNDIYTLVGKDSAAIGNNGRGLSMRGAQYNGLVFRVAGVAIYDTKPTADLRSTINNGGRHQVTAVLNRAHNVGYLYLDGQLVGTGSIPVTGSIQDSTNVVTIGKTMSASSFRFSGSIDDVRIYNRPLLSTEISQLYAATNQYATGECADSNGAIHPVATEICDGIDNDCDGLIDEAVVNTYWKDADSDLHSDGTRATGCSAPAGYGLALSPFASGVNGTGLSAGLQAYYTFDTNT